MSIPLFEKERYEQQGKERLQTGDLFSFPCPVIPIKTEGRTYGAVSRKAAELGIPFPKLVLGNAQVVVHNEKPYVFLAFWSDDNAYTEGFIINCVIAAMYKAALHPEPITQVAFTPLAGLTNISAMEFGITLCEHHYCDVVPLPDVVFVTDKYST